MPQNFGDSGGGKKHWELQPINLFGEGQASDPLDTERFGEHPDISDVVALQGWRHGAIDGQDQQDAIVLLLSLGIPAKVLRLVMRRHDRGTGSSSIKKMLELALGYCDLKARPKK